MDGVSWHEDEKYLRSAYFFLVIIRFLWTLLPQSGYIFPDEFFQSPEVMARDILSLNTTITWEWNETFLTRSPVSAFLSSGIPYMLLNMLHYLKLTKLTSYLLLVFPRIFMTLISILSFDIPVYILCRRLNLDPFNRLFVLSTSYVTQVFGTRPLSNVLETGLFGILLVLLIPPPPRNKKCPGNNDKDEKGQKGRCISNKYCVIAGSLTSLGFFCRQSFLGFAITPYMGWLIWQLRSQRSFAKIIQVVIKMMFMVFGFFFMSILIIVVDSWYFEYLQKGHFIFTPWNSIKYNAIQAHTHGHHPFFTHLFVNIPLLFGPIAFLYYFKLISLFTRRPLPIGDYTGENPIDNKFDLDYKYYCHLVFQFSILIPVLLLSFIPHQEPRFLIPVILPLILSFSKEIVGSKHSPTLLLSWYVWNLIGCLFFGVLHQGGVVPSLLYLEKMIKNTTKSSSIPFCHHIVYFHTYMPPNHLLAWPVKNSANGHWLYIHDLSGSSQEIFHETISKLKKEYCHENQRMLYVLCPGTVKIDIEDLQNVASFFPHLTMEDPPNFNLHLTQLIFGNTALPEHIQDYDDQANLSEDTNLHMYRVKMYIHNIIYQVQQIKSELSLTLYVLKI